MKGGKHGQGPRGKDAPVKGKSNRIARHDANFTDSDVFAIQLDSYHDHQTAFRFAINASGVKQKLSFKRVLCQIKRIKFARAFHFGESFRVSSRV